ncbi:hypothetical protein MASR2M66_03470 [Chloroflexota bacterium]
MGLFNNILQKLGLKKKEEEVKPAAAAAPAAKSAPMAPNAAAAGASLRREMDKETAAAAVAPRAVSEVDVVKQLEGLAAGKGLNWKVSIVDLLKLLDLDSSREAREELAKELNCPADMMGDSAKMNVWLHKEVLRKIAANGGNIPKDLLD